MDKEYKYVVYKHTSPSGKCYVGITSCKPQVRWGINGCNYITKINNRYKHPYFAPAILKYGWENFTHEIILTNISKSEAVYTEKYLIQWYKLHGQSYNLTAGGDGVLHLKMSKRTKEILRQKHIGIKQSPETIAKRVAKNKGKTRSMAVRIKTSKTVYQFDLDGNYICSYYSTHEAQRRTGVKSDKISSCCLNIRNRKSAGGFMWSYTPCAEKYCKNHHSSKRIAQYSSENSLIKIWNCMNDVITYCNISRYLLTKYCKNNIKDSDGYIWRWID